MDGTPFRRVYFPADHLEIQEAHVRGDNCDQNAHLISAAPDMYEALIPFSDAARDRASDATEWADNDTVSVWITIGDLRRARAALSKVEGQQ